MKVTHGGLSASRAEFVSVLIYVRQQTRMDQQVPRTQLVSNKVSRSMLPAMCNPVNDLWQWLQGARHIIASEGMRGLYQGLLPTLLRDVPEIAIQFALYEK